MKVLTVITARGGSVTLPRKNVLPFCGKPLIAYSIEAALQAAAACPALRRPIVSTEDEEIAETSRRLGAEVPFLRPVELARSETPSLPVVQHAVGYVEGEENVRYDWILLLQPTSPLRRAGDILKALEEARQPEASAVIAVTLANAAHPVKLKRIQDGILTCYLEQPAEQSRRQDFPFDVYRTNGAVYLTRRDVLMDHGSFYGSRPRAYVMPAERSIDIDTQLDFEIAEFLYRRNQTHSIDEVCHAHLR
jgi:CMP-N,N'-diacetyllegionaminic acid synthase